MTITHLPLRPRAQARAFTLVELSISALLAFAMLAIAWTVLWQYTRAYGSRDENLERSRKLQSVFDTLRDDVDRGTGSIQIQDVPRQALEAVGFPGDGRAFLTRPRRAINIINAFHSSTDTHPYLSKRYHFQEIWKVVIDPDGKEEVVLDPKATAYTGETPPGHIWDPEEGLWIRPSTTSSVIHVTDPPGGDDSRFLAILKGGAIPGVVIWAHHKKPKPGIAAGTLIRWSARTGRTLMTAGDMGHFEVEILADWAFWDKDPPERPIPWVLNPKILVGLSLGFCPPGQPPAPPGTTPRSSSARDPGAFEDIRIILYPATS